MVHLSNIDKKDPIITRAIKMADIFSKSTGIDCFSSLINPESMENFLGCNCAFCIHLENITQNKINCSKQYIYAAHKSDSLGGQYIYMCANGFCHFSAPLRESGRLVGLISGGPILMSDKSDFLASDFPHNSFTTEEKSLLQSYLDHIPDVTPLRVRNLADLLTVLADELNCEQRAEESKALLKQQSDLSSTIHKYKNLENANDYPIEKEEELFSFIEKGESDKAKAILNELLGIIYFTSGGEFEIIKSRTIELIVLLSRSAMRGGADSNEIFGLNYQYINEISAFSNIEQLSRWLVNVTNRFTERVIAASAKKAGILEPAIKYINANYSKKITLEEAAEKVYITPVYFSMLFKKNMGLSFSDYINKLRVEYACRLLLNEILTLSDVAQLSGFNDQSYFSKVFKEHMGVSPKKYKTEKFKIIKEVNVL